MVEIISLLEGMNSFAHTTVMKATRSERNLSDILTGSTHQFRSKQIYTTQALIKSFRIHPHLLVMKYSSRFQHSVKVMTNEQLFGEKVETVPPPLATTTVTIT
jgi:hypothetical protein